MGPNGMYDSDGGSSSPSNFVPSNTPLTTSQPQRRSGSGGTLFGALAGGVMDMANNALSALFAKNQQNRQIDENQKNRDWQEMMYNKYESPTAQAQQMLKAGLNPAGAVGSQSVGSASTSSLPTSQLPGIGAGIMQGAQLGLQMKAQKLEERKQAFAESIGLREQLRKELETASTVDEKNALIDNYRQMFNGLKLDNDAKAINNKYLDSLLSKDVELKSEQISFSQAQREFQDAQTRYTELMAKIAEEKKQYEINRLKAEANALMASAVQSYANALYAHAQAEVAKSTKLKIDNDVVLANNEDARKAALHSIELQKQELIKSGLNADLVNKQYQNLENRIMSGDIRNGAEFARFCYETLKDILTIGVVFTPGKKGSTDTPVSPTTGYYLSTSL